MLNKKTRNIFIDIFKYFLAFLIVNLHCGEQTYHAYSRLAVPMFFMISGYFLYKRGATHKENTEAGLNYLLRAVTYCIGAFIFQIMGDIAIMHFFQNGNISSYFYDLYKQNFFSDVLLLNHPVTQGYHLWFLLALLDVGIVHYLLVRFNKTHWYAWIAPLGLGISYFFGPGAAAITGSGTLTEAYRNGLLWGVPYAAVGYYMARYKNENEKRYVKYIFLVLGIVFFLGHKYESKLQEAFLSTTFCAYCMLRYLSSLKSPDCKYFYKYVGSQGSYYIYVSHILVFYMYLFSHTLFWGRKATYIVFFTSFAMYEAAYLLVMLGKYLRKRIRKAHQRFPSKIAS